MPPSTRASIAPGVQQPSSRALAEELEKTEQSITLALQEIDRNFSRANKVVGESILPVIEKYSAQSRNMWAGAAFWKQFLEAAANVSLSGYEENAHEETQEGEHATEDEENDYISMTIPVKQEGEEQGGSTVYGEEGFGAESSTPNRQRRVSSPSKIPRPTSRSSRSTPRRESERQQPLGDDDVSMDLEKDIPPPPRLSMAMEPSGSELLDDNDDSSTFVKRERPSTPPAANENRPPDNGTFKTPKSVLRHQVLDKNWRIQATPYNNRQEGQSPVKQEANKFSDFDSPDIQPPKLKSHIFDSPQDVSMTSPQAAATPVRKPPEKSQLKTPPTNRYYDSDSDTDMLPAGMSPPVTMHFSTHVGNNDLVKTPARQAAKTIVDDILRDVGGADESESFASIGQQYTRYKTDWSDDDDL
ncbi:hypothetical protein TRICI_003321 [Trichomonascus ciferrii]|uniref:DASH complex subunit ASK1 n=1 Tax=Trichomonascus ciferrii TaxID=44093 RepID=A0A642VAD2_9ASCO|nr:hypothetical protein TRICI_003321 [Trichomonascus ciferrii]